MSVFLVRMEHPDGPEWNRFVVEHVAYLQTLIGEGRLLASGPMPGTARRTGFLIFQAQDIAQVRQMVEADPFQREQLICALSIEPWDPLFGCFSALSSQSWPPRN